MYDAARYVYDAPPSMPKFTGKEGDTESGLDNFGARHVGPSLGRFMTPDPLGGQKIESSDPEQIQLCTKQPNQPDRGNDCGSW